MKLKPGHFFGATHRISEVVGITLIDSVYQAEQKHPRHSHEYASFCLVLKGSFTESHKRKTITCGPLTLLYYPADEGHSDHFHSLGGRCFIIELRSRWIQRLREASVVLDTPACFNGGKPVNLAMNLYRESCVMDDLSALSIEGLTLEMVAEISRRKKESLDLPAHSRIKRARELLHERFAEKLTLTSVAEAIDVHPAYLACQFRKRYGCSVGEYIRYLRVQFAYQKLVGSDESLVEISQSVGFFDQSHFTRTFKNLTGMTPSMCRLTGRSR
jgi:AraC family transcriptional regulator